MAIVSTTKDEAALSLTVVAEWAAPPERVWQVWVDPRQLERWWGPPYWPATFERHDVRVGGESRYYMSGPDGEKPRGWWRFRTLEEPTLLEFEDGFADDSGEPVTDMPAAQRRVDIESTPSGSRMTVRTTFASVEHMERVVAMGIVEGMIGAITQIDDVLTGK